MDRNITSTAIIDFSWRFAGLFALYSGGLLLILQFSPHTFITDMAEATASATVFFWRAFTIPFIQNGFFISLHDFFMVISLECTAAHYMLFAAAAVLAYPSHSFSYKAAGLLVLTFAIVLLNLVRIGILGLVGYYANSFFSVVHNFIWQGLFALLVIALCILWMRGWRTLSRVLLRYALFGLAAAAVSFWLLSKTLPYYNVLLAGSANLMSPLISLVTPLPEATGTEGVFITYLVPGGLAFYDISANIMNTIVFCTLSAVTSSFTEKRLFLKTFFSGLLLLFLIHLGYVILGGIMRVRSIDENAYGDLIRGSAFMAPILVWFIVDRIFRQRKDPAMQQI